MTLPARGGRKTHHRLKARKVQGVPAPGTMTGILRRHGLLDDEESARHKARQRFEAEGESTIWERISYP
jgi:hypothetical protein